MIRRCSFFTVPMAAGKAGPTEATSYTHGQSARALAGSACQTAAPAFPVHGMIYIN